MDKQARRQIRVKNWRLWALAGIAILTLVYTFLRQAPIGERTITLTARGEQESVADGSEIWLRRVEIDGKEYAPEEVFTGKWIEEKGYYVWRDFDQPEGMTDSLKATFPGDADVDMYFESNRWRGILRVQDGCILPRLYRVNCYRDTGAEDELISYKQTRMAPGILRAARLLLFYATAWILITEIRQRILNRRRMLEQKTVSKKPVPSDPDV